MGRKFAKLQTSCAVSLVFPETAIDFSITVCPTIFLTFKLTAPEFSEDKLMLNSPVLGLGNTLNERE